MMIVGGAIHIQMEDRESMLEKIRQLMADSQSEEGCITYEFSLDLSDPKVLHLYEEWESAEALAAHLETNHFKRADKEIRSHFVKSAVKRYTAELAH